MTQRISVLGFALTALTVGGCAAEPTQTKSEAPQFAQDHEVRVTFHALTVVECNRQAVRCLIDHPLRPATCSLQLADCLATTAVEEIVDLADCTLENVGCSLDAIADVACVDLVDCQQDVARCVSDTVNDVAGIDVTPVLDELAPYVDEAGEFCGEAVEVVGEVADVVKDTAGDAVENAIDALQCAGEARACVRENPRRWLPCQADFAACSAEVAANAVDDGIETIQEAGDIVEGVVTDAVGDARGTIDCAAGYRECRVRGGDYWTCSEAARTCELEVL